MSRIFPEIALLLFSVIQAPQATLLVEVLSGGRPVAGADVRAGGQSAKSNAQGHARLELPPGTWQVIVGAEGFHENKAEVRLQAGEETRVEIELSVQSERKEEIVVTAVRTERRLEDQPVRVEVIERDDIEEKALMTPGSVAMLLGETTGLRVQTTSPSLGAANVRIQGLRGRYSQVLSDGLPIYGLQGDSLSLLQVPPLDLGQVEVIKGAASALYGPSAIGGIVNMVSQRPLQRHRELMINQTSREGTDLTFWAVEPPHGNWAFTAIGGLHRESRQDIDGDGWTDLPQYLRGAFRPRMFWDDGHGHTVFATLGFMAEDRSGGTMPDTVAPDGKPFDEQVDSRRVDGGTVVRLALGKKRVMTFRGSFSHRGESHVFGEDIEHAGNTTWLGEFSLVGSAGRHTWVVGGALQQDRYSSRELPGFDYNFTTPGIFAQDEIDLSSKFTLGLSGRIDHHSRYGTFASPRVSLLFKPSTDWRARLSVGTGFFAPTPLTEETEETGLSRLRPLKNLVAERARSASLDGTWSRGPVEVVATLFGSLVHDPIERRYPDSTSAELFNAAGPVRTWGTELIVRYRIEDFLLLATHNYTRATEDDPEQPGRRSVPLTPAQYTSFNALWEKEHWGRIGLEMYYIGRQPLEDNPYRATGRGYFLYGLMFERTLGRLKIFANAEDLGNIRQTRYDPLLRRNPLPDGRWTVDSWAPLDGRVINGGIRVTF
ncbi:MAG TPA: TonB-dependent receptor [Acidobacteriota bacterium]|nr:TonB-dependent receptor [Acidobacteriota bacterium]